MFITRSTKLCLHITTLAGILYKTVFKSSCIILYMQSSFETVLLSHHMASFCWMFNAAKFESNIESRLKALNILLFNALSCRSSLRFYAYRHTAYAAQYFWETSFWPNSKMLSIMCLMYFCIVLHYNTLMKTLSMMSIIQSACKVLHIGSEKNHKCPRPGDSTSRHNLTVSEQTGVSFA